MYIMVKKTSLGLLALFATLIITRYVWLDLERAKSVNAWHIRLMEKKPDFLEKSESELLSMLTEFGYQHYTKRNNSVGTVVEITPPFDVGIIGYFQLRFGWQGHRFQFDQSAKIIDSQVIK